MWSTGVATVCRTMCVSTGEATVYRTICVSMYVSTCVCACIKY